MTIFDSHAHYDDEKFDGNRDEILKEVYGAGVEKICNIGSSLASSRKSVELSQKYDFVYASVGVHPSDAVKDMENPNWLDELEKMYTENDKVRAIGEIGLDYYWTPEEKEEQKVCFRAQMALAQAGIKLYGGVCGDADKAAEAFVSGELRYDPDAKCDHHEHHHGEGHTCGDHGCGKHNCHK